MFGASIVMFWTAVEKWLDNREVLGGTASYGLVVVVTASAVLAATAVADSGGSRTTWTACDLRKIVLLTTAQTICAKRRGRTTVDSMRPYAIEIAVTNVSKPAVIPVIV